MPKMKQLILVLVLMALPIGPKAEVSDSAKACYYGTWYWFSSDGTVWCEHGTPDSIGSVRIDPDTMSRAWWSAHREWLPERPKAADTLYVVDSLVGDICAVYGRPVAVIEYDTVVTETWTVTWDKRVEIGPVVLPDSLLGTWQDSVKGFYLDKRPTVKHTADTTITKRVRWLK